MELVAVNALLSGQEATISYTGPGGCQHYFPIFAHTYLATHKPQSADGCDWRVHHAQDTQQGDDAAVWLCASGRQCC